MIDFDTANLNKKLKVKTPLEIAQWAIKKAENPVITTNFRPYEVAILHIVSRVNPNIKVIWCDTGYNTPNTYNHANEVIDLLNIDVYIYVPKLTAAYRDVVMGVPFVDHPLHKKFTEQVKLEPFKRAMAEHKPDVWFTNIRKGQTAFRDSIDIVSKSADGILKVSPFYYWSDQELDTYLNENNLPNEFKYFDPTKQLENRECGLHT